MSIRDSYWMGLALELALRGQGRVEPNPMVGCVIVADDQLIASGFHQKFGGPHAEVFAFAQCDPKRLEQATVYVTLEPCSHHGKTPPCIDLFLRNPPKRIVVAMQDPFPAVAGKGIAALRERGIQVDVGACGPQAEALNAPYLKRLKTGVPWVIAKWAMTLDGALATKEHHSQWISNEQSRHQVHRLRGRVDSILIGIGTAIADNPMLTTRGLAIEDQKRIATRVVLDRNCRLLPESNLVRSVDAGSVIVVVSERSPLDNRNRLLDLGCELLVAVGADETNSLEFALRELGKRGHTNTLIEGGGGVLGSAFDRGLVDEIHCFISPKVIGGANAIRIGGSGKSSMADAILSRHTHVETLGQDVYVRGRVQRD